MGRNYFVAKAESLLRLAMLRSLSATLPLYIVTEYPKSGGTWVGQMLSECLDVPFPRNKFPRLESCVMHGHYLPTNGMKNVFVIMRDGRDIMVSYYYHSLFKHEKHNERFVEQNRKKLGFSDCEDIQNNLPKFIDFVFNNKTKYPSFTWSEFVNRWTGENVAIIRYEKLLVEPQKELVQALKIFGAVPEKSKLDEVISRYSFRQLTQRDPGVEKKNSFLRKGIAGDWKNNFNQESKIIFNEFGGNELIKLGYENNRAWVDS